MSFIQKKTDYHKYLEYWFNIQKSNNLTPMEKLILQRIKLFIIENNVPFHNSNLGLGIMIKVHEKSISRSINSLIKRGYIHVLAYNGKNRVIICTNKID